MSIHRTSGWRALAASCGRRLAGAAVAGALVVGLSAGLTACSNSPSHADCQKLLDHTIDVVVNSAGTDSLTPEMKADLDKQKKELHGYLKKSFLSKCEQDLSRKHVKCALKAKTRDELAACDKS